jgi:hypothetical protein
MGWGVEGGWAVHDGVLGMVVIGVTCQKMPEWCSNTGCPQGRCVWCCCSAIGHAGHISQLCVRMQLVNRWLRCPGAVSLTQAHKQH